MSTTADWLLLEYCWSLQKMKKEKVSVWWTAQVKVLNETESLNFQWEQADDKWSCRREKTMREQTKEGADYSYNFEKVKVRHK